MDGQYWKGDRTMSTNEWLLTSDFWQFIEPWHGRWYENEIFIASCTDNICDLENERWLLGDIIDHVGMYGSGVAERLSAFSVGLVHQAIDIGLFYYYNVHCFYETCNLHVHSRECLGKSRVVLPNLDIISYIRTLHIAWWWFGRTQDIFWTQKKHPHSLLL